MLKPLTNEQQIKVEENMGLVGKVIQDCVHTLGTGCIYDYDDLFQIGCIGLCKAAQTDQPGYNVAFSTYAYRLIRNEIYTQLEYATRRSRVGKSSASASFLLFWLLKMVIRSSWRITPYRLTAAMA